MPASKRVQRILNKKSLLSEQDRLFLLKYAGDTPKSNDQKSLNGESIDQLFKNLIIIINHFFEYGFIKNKVEPAHDSDNDEDPGDVD